MFQMKFHNINGLQDNLNLKDVFSCLSSNGTQFSFLREFYYPRRIALSGNYYPRFGLEHICLLKPDQSESLKLTVAG